MRMSVWQRKVRINVVEGQKYIILYKYTIADAAVVYLESTSSTIISIVATAERFGCGNRQKRLVISILFIKYVVRNLLGH